MNDLPIALLAGFCAGFFGAIPPGPLNITIIRKASQAERKDAFRVALGGALVDTLICGLIGLGLGWILEKVVTNAWVKGPLAIFLLVYGLKILLVDRRRDAAATPREPVPATAGDPPPLAHVTARLHHAAEMAGVVVPPPVTPRGTRFPFLVGVLQGAANPALFVNWTIFISFVVGHGLLKTGRAPAAGFALGVGLGVFAWFALLVELVDRLRNHPVGRVLRESTVVAGLLLFAFGLYFTWKTLAEP